LRDDGTNVRGIHNVGVYHRNLYPQDFHGANVFQDARNILVVFSQQGFTLSDNTLYTTVNKLVKDFNKHGVRKGCGGPGASVLQFKLPEVSILHKRNGRRRELTMVKVTPGQHSAGIVLVYLEETCELSLGGIVMVKYHKLLTVFHEVLDLGALVAKVYNVDNPVFQVFWKRLTVTSGDKSDIFPLVLKVFPDNPGRGNTVQAAVVIDTDNFGLNGHKRFLL
jgi:hypothetical protein